MLRAAAREDGAAGEPPGNLLQVAAVGGIPRRVDDEIERLHALEHKG